MATMIFGTDKENTIPLKTKFKSDNSYPIFSRVKDNNGTEVGTVFGYRYNDSGVKRYICVVGDSNKRVKNMEYMSLSTTIGPISSYSDIFPLLTSNLGTAANYNNYTINWCNMYGYTYQMITYCRTLETINIGEFGLNWQVPLFKDLVTFLMYADTINNLDPYYSADTGISRYGKYISCDQKAGKVWAIGPDSSSGTTIPGMPISINRDRATFPEIEDYLVVPILEIPIF